MRKFGLAVMASTVAFGLSGCDKTRETLGLKRVQADEFEVADRQPLSVPPDYALRPPVANAPAKGEVVPAEKAKEALIGLDGDEKKEAAKKAARNAKHLPKSASAAEKELLTKADAVAPDASVRDDLKKETPAPDAEAAPGEDLVFWKDKKSKKTGEVIDPKEENRKHNGQDYGVEATDSSAKD